MPSSASTSTAINFGSCILEDDAQGVVQVGGEEQCQNYQQPCVEDTFKTGLETSKTCLARDIQTTKCVGSATLGFCTPSGCGSGATTIDDGCNLLKHDSTQLLTVYGACQEKFSKTITGCFKSHEDCLDSNGDGLDDSSPSERYLEPDALFALLAQPEQYGVAFSDKLYCDCSDVLTGACVVDDITFDDSGKKQISIISSYCTTSAGACNDDEVFYNARKVMQMPNLLQQCTLCRASDITAETRNATNSFIESHKAQLLANIKPDIVDEGTSAVPAADSDRSNNNNSNAGVVIGLVFGGVVCAGLIVALIWLARWRFQSASAKNDSDMYTERDQDGAMLPVDDKEMA